MEPEILYPLQLLDVRLYTATLERFTPEKFPAESNAAQDKSAPFLGVNVEIVRHTEHRRLSVFLTLELKGPDGKHPEFRLHFVLEGLFEAQCDFDAIEAAVWEEFEQTSAITLLWPYAREYAHSFARRMRADLPVLPTLHRLRIGKVAEAATPPEDLP